MTDLACQKLRSKYRRIVFGRGAQNSFALKSPRRSLRPTKWMMNLLDFLTFWDEASRDKTAGWARRFVQESSDEVDKGDDLSLIA